MFLGACFSVGCHSAAAFSSFFTFGKETHERELAVLLQKVVRIMRATVLKISGDILREIRGNRYFLQLFKI